MFNVAFKLRSQNGFCIPTGPSFDSARIVECTFDETKIKLKLPKHNSRYSSVIARQPKKKYHFNDMTFRSYSKNIVVDDSWNKFDVLSRSWAFNGDWFTGPLSELSMYMGLIRKTEINPEVSLFNPKAFEVAIADFLTQQYSARTIQEIPSWVTPCNWTVIKHLTCIAAYFEVKPREGINEGAENYVLFPIDNQHIALLSFRQSRFLNKSEEELDNLVDPQPMNDLMWDIINSIQINLSKDATKQQIKALEGLDNPLLVESFPPLKWGATDMDKLEETHK